MTEEKKIPTFSGIRCPMCREIKNDDKLMKKTLGNGRFSIFCGTCQAFLFIYDLKASKELDDMIKTRNKIETKQKSDQHGVE